MGRPTSCAAASATRRGGSLGALGQPVDDVLGDDDGGVDQQAHGDRQAAQGHGVQADAQRPQHQAGHGQRQRDGQRDHAARPAGCRAARRSPAPRTPRPAAPPGPRRPAPSAPARPGRRRCAGARPRGRPARQLGDRPPHALGHLHRVRAELLDHPAAHHLALAAGGRCPAARPAPRAPRPRRPAAPACVPRTATTVPRMSSTARPGPPPAPTTPSGPGRRSRRRRSGWRPPPRASPRPGSRRGRPADPGRAAPGTAAGSRPAARPPPPRAPPAAGSSPRTPPGRAAPSGRPCPARPPA